MDLFRCSRSFALPFCLAIGTCLAIEIPYSWRRVISEATKRFDSLSPSLTPCIIDPRQVIHSKMLDAEVYFCPRIMLWYPLYKCHRSSRWPLLCPDYYNVLTPTSQWLNGSTNARNPRALWDGSGLILLVAREYECPGSITSKVHRLRTTDSRLLSLVEQDAYDVLFSHKLSFLKSFLSSMSDFMLSGMSFQQIFFYFCIKRYKTLLRFHGIDITTSIELRHQSVSSNETIEKLDHLKEVLIETVPDGETLKGVFNNWCRMNKEFYDNSMRSKDSLAIMVDHTFKVCFILYTLLQNKRARWFRAPSPPHTHTLFI